MQDWSVQHERCDEKANPSEKIIQEQIESASTMWANLESEESLVPSLGLPKPATSSTSGTSNPATHGGGANRNSKNGKLNAAQATQHRASTQSTAVEAAKQRTKTFRDYRAVEQGMTRARDLADKILNETALKAHNGCQDRHDMVSVFNIITRKGGWFKCSM